MALLQEADRFVVADTFQYSRRSYQNRARLRTPQGAQWITVPVKRGQTHRPVAEVEIDNREHWRSRHWRALQYDYRSTPFFELCESSLAPFFERGWQRLGPCAFASVELLVDRAGIETEILRATALPGAPDTLPGLLRAADAEGETLLTPPEAVAHDAALLEAVGGDVRVLSFEPPHYRQNFAGFEPGLSFADLLFGYGPEARALLASGSTVGRVER